MLFRFVCIDNNNKKIFKGWHDANTTSVFATQFLATLNGRIYKSFYIEYSQK